MTQRRILVVEDEQTVADVVARYLKRDEHDVRTVGDGNAALDEFGRFAPDLVILDIMLPGIDGLEVCRRIRQQGETPIILLTARGEEVDKLLGLRLGADDYIAKPFSPRELAARVTAVLRRSAHRPFSDAETIRWNELRINPATRVVEDRRGELPLTAREFDLLYHLARHPGQVFSRDQLMTSVWDFEFPGDSGTVTVHMRRLRAKVEADPSRPRHLKTVWGVGYKLSRELTATRLSRFADPRIGAPLALLLAVTAGLLLAELLMSPPSSELREMGVYLTLSGALTLAIGWIALQIADRLLSIPIGLRALLGSLAGTAIAFLNVLIIAELMFVSTTHDLQLLIAVAGFSGIVTICFNTWMATSVTTRIRDVTRGIGVLADGNYSNRLRTPGRDEVALLAADIDVLAERLQQAERERAAVDGERRDLVASISHDLRTPLASVRAVVEALDDDVISGRAETARYHAILRREVDRMSRMIDDLFELARIDAGALQLQKERVALQEIAAEVVDAMQLQAQQRSIELTLRESSESPPIPVDGARIERAIANLVRNALEHTPAGGRIDLETHARNGHVELAVRDTGAGLDGAQLAEIWKPFYRGTSSRGRDATSDGAGLGLAIVRGIVEAHGGSVDAASEPGLGATFTLRLPAEAHATLLPPSIRPHT